MLSAVFEVLSARADTDEPLFWQNARRQASTVDASSVEANRMFILL